MEKNGVEKISYLNAVQRRARNLSKRKFPHEKKTAIESRNRFRQLLKVGNVH